jgi:hypothetical protein
MLTVRTIIAIRHVREPCLVRAGRRGQAITTTGKDSTSIDQFDEDFELSPWCDVKNTFDSSGARWMSSEEMSFEPPPRLSFPEWLEEAATTAIIACAMLRFAEVWHKNKRGH